MKTATGRSLKVEYHCLQVLKQTNAVYAANCSTPAAWSALLLRTGVTMVGSELSAAMVCCTGFGVAICRIADCSCEDPTGGGYSHVANTEI